MFKNWLVVLLGLFLLKPVFSQEPVFYLFPGQGSDSRIFDSLNLDANFTKVYIDYPDPNRKESLNQYAMRFVSKIDTNLPYYFIGVSLGGMICAELNEVLNPEKCILISSAKNKNEIPNRYRFMRWFPIYKVIPAAVYKWSSYFVQPLFEPDRKRNKETFKVMLKAKNPKFIKRATHMIVQWQLMKNNHEIYSIHGEKDHTLPLKKNNHNYVVDDGSHMMMLTKGTKISGLINQIIEMR